MNINQNIQIITLIIYILALLQINCGTITVNGTQCEDKLQYCTQCSVDPNKCDACNISNYYLDPNGNCQNCSTLITNCVTCTSSSNCTSCTNNQYAINSGNQCQLCSDLMTNCSTCTSSSNCTGCANNFSALNSTNQC